MIGADNVLAKGDGGTIKHGQLPLRQENVRNGGARWDGKMSEMSEQWRSKMGWENVGNVGAMVEQYGMGKCRSNGGARWDGKMSEMSEQSRSRWTGKTSEQSWSKVGKKMVYDNLIQWWHGIHLIGMGPTFKIIHQ